MDYWEMEHPPTPQGRPRKPLTRPYLSSSSKMVLNMGTILALITVTASAAYAYAITTTATTDTAQKVSKLEAMAVEQGIDIEKLKLQREHANQLLQAFEKRLEHFEEKLDAQHVSIMDALHRIQRQSVSLP